MVLTITFLLLTILVNRAVSEDADIGREGRLFSFEDSLSRADVGTYYLSFVVALAMLVPVFYLSLVGTAMMWVCSCLLPARQRRAKSFSPSHRKQQIGI